LPHKELGYHRAVTLGTHDSRRQDADEHGQGCPRSPFPSASLRLGATHGSVNSKRKLRDTFPFCQGHSMATPRLTGENHESNKTLERPA
jgi:hypothetical protein